MLFRSEEDAPPLIPNLKLKSPDQVLRDCFQFLGIDHAFVPPEVPSPHASGMPKSKILQMLVTRTKALRKALKIFTPARLRKKLNRTFEEINLQKAKLDPQIRAELNDCFREDIIKLQDLIGRDLSNWLNSPTVPTSYKS